MTTVEKEQLVIDNIALIHSIINNHFSNYPDKEDLLQEGSKAMWSAADNYDGNLGAKFTTFAYPHIYWAMRKYARENKGIKVSRNLTKINLMIEKATILLAQNLMREPSTNEIANYLEIPEIMIAEAIGATYKIQSIDEPLNYEGKDVTLQDTIGYEEDIDNLISLRSAIKDLDPLERELIVRRYMEDQTQQETADILDMSQVQVYRKEQKVLSKLKNKLVA